MNLKKTLTQMTAALLLGSATAHADIVPVTEDVVSNTTWYGTNTYVLQTVVYVREGATLTIEPGTVVKGGTNAATLLERDGIPNKISALWVARGSKLYATGTVAQPIIFTYEGDDVSDPNDVPFNTSGQWGGVVLCGYGQLNTAKSVDGGAATPMYDQFEGTTSPGTNDVHLFGGNDDADNSGALRYVSIRYSGNVFAPAAEMNALTMAGVGSGTTIEYVEVLNSSDDGFEWWGGSVNTKYLVAAFCEDDDFDTDQGYRGTNQFWFGIKPPWAGTSDSRGMEIDGDLNQAVSGEAPKSQWVVHNATLIGRGQGATGFGGGAAINSRDEAAPNVYNSVITDFAFGFKIDGDGLAEFTNNEADVRNTIVSATAGTSDANGAFLFTDVARNNTLETALLGGVSYTNNAGLNPRPQTGSPALGNVAPQGTGLATTSYRGAFSTSGNWADGWTALSATGFLSLAPNVAQPPTLSYTVSGTDFVLSFPTQAGFSYQVQSSDDLVLWIDEGPAVIGTGSPMQATSPTGSNVQAFFRVIVE